MNEEEKIINVMNKWFAINENLTKEQFKMITYICNIIEGGKNEM